MTKLDKIEERDFKDLIEIITNFYSEKIDENIKSHRSEFTRTFEMFEHLKVIFFLFSIVINEKFETQKFKGRCYLSKYYLDVIANNFQVSKNLFEQGFHIQLQLIFRNQFEFINTLIAYIGDEDFFKKYGGSSERLLTPKPINTEKTIKKIMRSHISENFNDFWKTYQTIISTIYSELSINAHGNIPSIALQSLEGVKDDDETYNRSSCGVSYPLKVTREMIKQMFNYFQISSNILFIFLEKEKMLDKENPFYNFVEYHSKRFRLITFE